MDYPCLTWPILQCSTGEVEESGEITCPHLLEIPEAKRELIIQAAIEYLWSFTGKRFGLCEVSIRPCDEACRNTESTYRGFSGAPAGFWWGLGAPPMQPYILNGNWYNMICGSCGGRCSCGNISNIVLPGPVDSIVEVRVDGVVLPESAYRLDNLGLARIDGESWPRCQNMAADPLTDDDTFMVTFLQGTPVPAGGQLAAGTLACELAKQACGARGCRLPRRVQSIIREGVEVYIQDDFRSLYSNGSTGLWEVDSFVAAANKAARTGFKVMSPDLQPRRRVY